MRTLTQPRAVMSKILQCDWSQASRAGSERLVALHVRHSVCLLMFCAILYYHPPSTELLVSIADHEQVVDMKLFFLQETVSSHYS